MIPQKKIFRIALFWLVSTSSFQAAAAIAGQAVPISATQAQQLVASLKDPQPAVRAKAATDLAKAPLAVLRKAMPLLIDGLADKSAAVRIACATTLGSLGKAAQPAVPALIELLSGSADPQMSGWQVNTYDSTDRVIETLAKIGPGAREAIPHLTQALTDKNQFYRRDKILLALLAIGPDAASTPLVMKIVEEEGRYTKARHIAIRVLGEIKPAASEAVQMLSGIMREDTDAVARAEADRALQKIFAEKKHPSSSSISKLTENLFDGNSADSKILTLQELKELGPQASPALSVLIQCLDDADQGVRTAALDTIGAIGPQADPALPALVQRALNGTNRDQRQSALNAIACIDQSGKKTLPLLTPSLSDPFKVRSAIEILDRFATTQTTAAAQSARKRWHIQ